jgi:magnesium-transporting ATPase (P-type)
MSLFAVGGSFLFLGFLQPEIAYNQLKLRYASFAILPMLLVAIYVPLLTFGHSTASTFLFPFIMVTDIVEVNWLMFERTSLFFTLSMIAFALLFMSLTLWNAFYMVQRVVKIKPVLVGVTICFLTYVVSVFIDDWEHLERLLGWNTLLRLYIMFVIPAGTIALAIRHRGKGAAPHAQGQ